MKIQIWSYRYIVFYAGSGILGHCDIEYESKIKTSADLTKIEKELSGNIKDNISITDFKYVGRKWK
jgi:hypothetical protein